MQGSVLGPPITGAPFDMDGDYEMASYLTAGMMVVGTCFLVSLESVEVFEKNLLGRASAATSSRSNDVVRNNNKRNDDAATATGGLGIVEDDSTLATSV